MANRKAVNKELDLIREEEEKRKAIDDFDVPT